MARFVINLKSYAQAAPRTLDICTKAAASASDVDVIVAPSAFYVSEAAKMCTVYAQHVDDLDADRNTGFVPAELAQAAGASGSIINHSEHRLPRRRIRALIERLRGLKMVSLACARDVREATALARLGPDMIAVEPPGLIGGDVSVSTAQPALIERSVRAVKDVDPKIEVLVGAGVRTAKDIKIALELGADGVLLASEVAKAKDPAKTIEKLLKGFNGR